MLHAAGALGKQLPGARGGPEVRAPGSSEACSRPAPLRAVGGAPTRASAHRACSRRSAGPCVGLSGDSAGRMTVCAAQGGGRLRSAPQTHVNVDRSQPREDREGGREAWEGGRPRGRGSSKAEGERTSETAEFRDGL